MSTLNLKIHPYFISIIYDLWCFICALHKGGWKFSIYFQRCSQVSQSNYKSSPKDQPHTKTILQSETIYFKEEEKIKWSEISIKSEKYKKRLWHSPHPLLKWLFILPRPLFVPFYIPHWLEVSSGQERRTLCWQKPNTHTAKTIQSGPQIKRS